MYKSTMAAEMDEDMDQPDVDDDQQPMVTPEQAETSALDDDDDDDETLSDDGQPMWLNQLHQELAKPYPDRVVLKSLCSGQRIPFEVRGALWQSVLGVQRKPNVLRDWQPSGELKTGALLRAECEAQADRIDCSTSERNHLVDTMELVLQFYCNVRSVEYRPGWAEVLQPLSRLSLSSGEIYNCFYAMLDKYIPYSNAQSNKLPYRVFRLLLQYHDPQLSHFLDTMRVDPHLYVYNWFRSLYVNAVPADVAMALWDSYLLEGDPYMVFFMSLVLLINARDAILAAQSSEELEALLPTLPSPLSAEDAEDFVACAHHYGVNTPFSVRQKDLQSHLFATNKTQDSKVSPAVTSVLNDLCLSVSAAEICQQAQLTRQSAHRLKYLVIDTRPAHQFECGRLATAFHVDPNMMLDNPEAFYDIVKDLEQMAEDHLCFYGTGTDNDTHLRAIVSHFLQRNFKNISYVRGGYEALHNLLKRSNLSELADHNAAKCVVCTPPGDVDYEEIRQPELEREQAKPRFAFGFGRRSSDGVTTSSFASLAKKLTALKANESTPQRDPLKVEAADVATKASTSDDGLAEANSWTGLSSFVKKGNDLLEKSKGAWDKFQAVTAPIEKSPNGSPSVPRRVSAESLVAKQTRQRDVFGIGGSDDEENVSSDEGGQDSGPPSRKSSGQQQMVSEDLSSYTRVTLDEWTKAIGAVHEFPGCNEIIQQGAWMPSCIVVTPSEFFVLRAPMDHYPEAFIKERHPLKTLIKITAKKKHPNIITFSFKVSETSLVQRRFMLPNGRACSQEVGRLVLESVQKN